jgi:hypothetical protein
MQHYNWNKLDEIACKALNKYGVHIAYGLDDTPEDDKIAEFVCKEVRRLYADSATYHNFMSAIVCGGLLTFDTKEEAWAFYKIFEQELTDSSSIYACIYSPTEGCMTENT